jgi:hypothetical protein
MMPAQSPARQIGAQYQDDRYSTDPGRPDRSRPLGSARVMVIDEHYGRRVLPGQNPTAP